jgi:transposase
MRPEQRVEQRERWAATFPVHVGVDAGKSFHKLVASGRSRVRTKAIKVEVSREGFDQAVAFLRREHAGIRPSETLVGIEFAGHYGYTFAEYLRQLGFVIVTVPSVVTKRLKEVEDNSPRKDDAKDAAQICKLLGSGLFVSYAVLAPDVAEMRVLATERHRLAVEQVRLKNRLQGALDLVWPEFAGHFSGIDHPTPRAMLRRWPTAADTARAQVRSVQALMRLVSLNHLGRERAEELVAAARSSIAVPSATEARRAEIRRLLDRWDLLLAQIAEVEATLSDLVARHPGAQALTTVPAVGVLCAATLVAEIGTPESFETPRQVLKLAGMNLARKESGTSLRGRVRQTKRGRPLLRRQLFLLAGRWCQPGGLYRDEYLAMVERNGGRKISALCAMARRLVPLLLAVLQTAQPFDPARWETNRMGGHGPYRAA